MYHPKPGKFEYMFAVTLGCSVSELKKVLNEIRVNRYEGDDIIETLYEK